MGSNACFPSSFGDSSASPVVGSWKNAVRRKATLQLLITLCTTLLTHAFQKLQFTEATNHLGMFGMFGLTPQNFELRRSHRDLEFLAAGWTISPSRLLPSTHCRLERWQWKRSLCMYQVLDTVAGREDLLQHHPQATQILRKCVYQSEIVRKGPRYGAIFVSSAAPHSWNETIHVRWHTTLEDGTSPLTCIGCLMFDKKTSWDYPTTVPFISGLNKLADSVAKIDVKCHHIISFLAINHTKNRRNRIFSGKKMSRLF